MSMVLPVPTPPYMYSPLGSLGFSDSAPPRSPCHLQRVRQLLTYSPSGGHDPVNRQASPSFSPILVPEARGLSHMTDV